MSLTRREMCLLFPSALLPALLVTKQTQEQFTLPSVLYPFDKLPVHISTTAATCAVLKGKLDTGESVEDRKSTRLNSSHGYISYAVFCLKKKKNKQKS